MNGIVGNVIVSMLKAIMLSWFGVAVGIAVTAGLGMVALYFLNKNFRTAYNLIKGPAGKQAYYNKKGQVSRDGYTFDESSGTWRYVRRRMQDREYEGRRYGRTYTRYHKEF